jgi:hypothetical protein
MLRYYQATEASGLSAVAPSPISPANTLFPLFGIQFGAKP